MKWRDINQEINVNRNSWCLFLMTVFSSLEINCLISIYWKSFLCKRYHILLEKYKCYVFKKSRMLWYSFFAFYVFLPHSGSKILHGMIMFYFILSAYFFFLIPTHWVAITACPAYVSNQCINILFFFSTRFQHFISLGVELGLSAYVTSKPN